MRGASRRREEHGGKDTIARLTPRWGLLVLACVALALSLAFLVSCRVAGMSGAADSAAGAGAGARLVPTVTGHAGHARSAAPKPSPFTIGAWVSNSMPGANGRVTVYIICQIQDPALTAPSKPAGNLPVRITIGPPLNKTFTRVTGSDGIASVPLTLHHAHARSPIIVEVATTWQNVTYQSQTAFMPGPGGGTSPVSPRIPQTPKTPNLPGARPTPPPTPVTPAPTPTSSPDPAATPTPAPQPSPSPNPTATPTPAPQPEPTATEALAGQVELAKELTIVGVQMA